MLVVSLISTKGGVGKTTTAANIGGFAADAGLRVLLVDLDVQPTLSSYFALSACAEAGVYELLAFNETQRDRLVSRTAIPHLDLVTSNDEHGQLGSLLLHASDGRLRLRHLLPVFRPHYDLMLIDTQGARSVLLETALLASDLALSPVTPEMLAAREFHRGTLRLLHDLAPYRHLGIEPPPLHLLINRVPAVSRHASLIQRTLRNLFLTTAGVRVLDTSVPALEAYPRASALSLPVHRVEVRKPSGRVAPSACATMRALNRELFPQWCAAFDEVFGGHDGQHGQAYGPHGGQSA
ncbi:ParA family protein [Burkholderia pseudomallei]|uniref:ParA family protein n=1 Tax=Burkholderia pseudomallei TaxID=28450 RepID=UPI00016AF238|nr:ParA family protein [Burkholderia pseudomallei]MCW0111792.1 ParA family protein [Burkholderia pseudomallei]MCW0161178.1 ParA family protein [Burkholderia pseudomallei]MDY7815228.1 ParA family protein [Burkholderia pseudomallei]MDY7861789.1 ParA family protein [Burkholderia pseudomallei]CAJ4423245.1 cobQ/CobB/MinD/ParA nucleotide binding domain protein [Burkholderia pseudomallei]